MNRIDRAVKISEGVLEEIDGELALLKGIRRKVVKDLKKLRGESGVRASKPLDCGCLP